MRQNGIVKWTALKEKLPPYGQFVLIKLKEDTNYCALKIACAAFIPRSSYEIFPNVSWNDEITVVDESLSDDYLTIDKIEYWAELNFNNEIPLCEVWMSEVSYEYKIVWEKNEPN